MEQSQFQPIVNFIWSVADDLLRDVYVKGKYRDVILPMTIIRRIDAVLEPTKDKVLETYDTYKDKFENLDFILGGKQGNNLGFSNYSKFNLQTLLNDPKNIRINFENYLDCFSENIKDIILKFKFKNQLDTLEESNILFGVIERFCSPKVNFGIEDILDEKGNVIHKGLSNLGMGYVFEELIRKFNEENNEEAGEHFTPREIIELMTHLVFLPVKEQIKKGTWLIYDNACGSGGMLTESKEFITDPEGLIQSKANIYLYGQEINPETYAICKADMLIKGEDPDHIKFGSTLSNDQQDKKFDFMLSNPPYGKSWENDQKILGVEKKGSNSTCNDPRFSVGITSKSDGQMMFLLNMLSKMKTDTPLGSRIASVHNGSSLFNSDSGMVAIRKHIIENDYLEAIVALPTNMFYNTGIPTFIWIITNKKPEHKKGKVQLINATNEEYFSKMKKSLGSKQNEMTKEHIEKITKLFLENVPNKDCKIFDNEDFGYIKITIEKPKSIEILKDDEKFAKFKDKDKILEKLQELEQNPQDFEDRNEFISFLGVKLKKSEENLIIDSDKTNNTEKIPLKTNIQNYYDTEVKPYVKNSWIAWDSASVGYEILFNKYFYTYTPPRKLEEINSELEKLEKEVQDLLREIMQ
ncbi:SAM-dependent DNA methyltransferase [Campylobacter coli]|uniref:site-specific DNA-methyltransferase (adenine-specific) n=1 Tax=Campylobacter coli TaxID=195 RepID=A0A6C7JZD7_CAMCO|nr:class I SAM-dependent DNA methyltransferase [Campylobacter jejuni]EAH8728245.1 SAM-dependent DNA methyltransferase [Campylobacter coli]EAH9574063.1 SAM-dependent DNA methyltransferase [Campylobacter coli]EAJ0218582.1 SAM-dependent DNA methyltransferase [Campylobacter jejuni]EAJ0300505.1 SAM-dependent DNA methyltransferase [Campylobacter jejuni]EAJ9596139.1 SAM-dependent DNA methyltransferase [Campylobacter coli]